MVVLPPLAARCSGVFPDTSIWSRLRPSEAISSHSQEAIPSWRAHTVSNTKTNIVQFCQE